jgi:hypothetical protein
MWYQVSAIDPCDSGPGAKASPVVFRLEPPGQERPVLRVQHLAEGVLLQVGTQSPGRAGVTDVSGDGGVEIGLRPVDMRATIPDPAQRPAQLLRPAELAKSRLAAVLSL